MILDYPNIRWLGANNLHHQLIEHSPEPSKNQYLAELKINCDQFTYSIQNIDENKFHKNRSINFQVIQQNPRFISYQVANYLCFTMNSQNYNRKENEPDWVKKIINNIEQKKISNRMNFT